MLKKSGLLVAVLAASVASGVHAGTIGDFHMVRDPSTAALDITGYGHFANSIMDNGPLHGANSFSNNFGTTAGSFSFSADEFDIGGNFAFDIYQVSATWSGGVAHGSLNVSGYDNSTTDSRFRTYIAADLVAINIADGLAGRYNLLFSLDSAMVDGNGDPLHTHKLFVIDVDGYFGAPNMDNPNIGPGVADIAAAVSVPMPSGVAMGAASFAMMGLGRRQRVQV